MDTNKLFKQLTLLFEEEEHSHVLPTVLFNRLGELSATQIGEYLIDHYKVDEELAYELAVEWLDSDKRFKAYDSSN